MKMPILLPAPASRHLLLASAIALAVRLRRAARTSASVQEALERGDLATAQSNYQALAAMGYADAQVGLADYMQVASGDSAQQAKAEKLTTARPRRPRRGPRAPWQVAGGRSGASDAEHREAERLLSQAFEQGEDSALVPLIVLYLQYPQSWPEIDPQQRIDQWRARDCRRPTWRRSSSTAPRAPTPSTWARSSRSASAGCGAWTCAGTNWPRSTRCRATRKSRRPCSNSCAPPTRPAGCPASGSTRWPGARRRRTRPARPADRPGAAGRDRAELPCGLGQPGQAALRLSRPGRPGKDARLPEERPGRRPATRRTAPRAPLLRRQVGAAGPAQAERHLLKAAASEPQANYYLGQIYRRGFLGKVYPQKAVDHLILAPRRPGQRRYGPGPALVAGRGIQPNRVNAYVFGQLAVQQQVPQASDLLGRSKRNCRRPNAARRSNCSARTTEPRQQLAGHRQPAAEPGLADQRRRARKPMNSSRSVNPRPSPRAPSLAIAPAAPACRRSPPTAARRRRTSA